MDEVLKRRLVGAAVLVAGAFALASLLPDPGSDAPRNGDRVVTYDLRTGDPLELQREATAPAPQDTPAPALEPEPAPKPKAAAPKGTHLKVDESLGAHAAAWYLQIGSFGNLANAQAVRQKLSAASIPAVMQTVPVEGKVWYRVRVGPYASQAAAEKALNAVRKQGYPLAKLVRPDSPAGN